MAKELKVTLKDKDTLMLDEAGVQGDLINLKSVQNVDLQAIEKLIEDGKDSVYNKKLAEYKLSIQKEVEQEKTLLRAELEKDNSIELSKIKEENAKLKAEKATFEKEKNFAVSEALSESKDKIAELEKKLSAIEAQNELSKNELKTEIVNKYEEKLHQKDQEFAQLKFELDELRQTKIRLSNKEVGEDLESWCDQQAKNLMQIGFDNCTWEKDNKAVKEEGEQKATKADYLFKIYSDNEKTGNPLASICLEMKNNILEAEKHKKNSDHFDKLDKDRNKKDCKYAILVSNLELENDNILPIYKVNEYKDMYVVRPAYMTTLITIITSLTMKFKDLLLESENKKFEILKREAFIEEYEKQKNTYLDKPLKNLEEDIQKISKQSEAILKSAQTINDTCEHIVDSYIEGIKNKLELFNNKMKTAYNKYEK